MAKPTSRYISELLYAYQQITGRSCTEMALDFDVTLSNLYLYRSGTGNPRASTVDRIINEVERRCPAAYRKISRE